MAETGGVVENGHSSMMHGDESKKEEARLLELRSILGKADGDPLRIVGVGAGAWGSVFIAMLQDAYGTFRDLLQVCVCVCVCVCDILFLSVCACRECT
jgi:glycerol-3-phosphate dehydrogenase (NAD+)